MASSARLLAHSKVAPNSWERVPKPPNLRSHFGSSFANRRVTSEAVAGAAMGDTLSTQLEATVPDTTAESIAPTPAVQVEGEPAAVPEGGIAAEQAEETRGSHGPASATLTVRGFHQEHG